jgi:hypothetical protein
LQSENGTLTGGVEDSGQWQTIDYDNALRAYDQNDLAWPVTLYDPLVVASRTAANFYFGVFASTWNPDAYYYSGSDSQLTDPILDAALGTANVPAYRGL